MAAINVKIAARIPVCLLFTKRESMLKPQINIITHDVAVMGICNNILPPHCAVICTEGKALTVPAVKAFPSMVLNPNCVRQLKDF